MVKGFVINLQPTLLGILRKAKNGKFVVLGVTADGKYIQGGDKFFSAYIRATKIGTATNGAGRRGSDVEIDWMGSGTYLYTAGDPDLYPSTS